MSTDTNQLEAIIADHNKAMRTDMASELVGGNRSAAITDVITFKAILKWHQQQTAKEMLQHLHEYDDNYTCKFCNTKYLRLVDNTNELQAIQAREEQ